MTIRATTAAPSGDLRIEEFFTGHCKAWGLFQDRFGRLRRQFEADMRGHWDGRTLTLDEDFVYTDGGTERRTWRIEKIGKSLYRGRANGVVGTAEGKAQGKSLHLRYRFALPVGSRIWSVRFDDWMFLQGDGLLINRAEVSKFGVRLGQVICVIRALSPDSDGELFAPDELAWTKPSCATSRPAA